MDAAGAKRHHTPGAGRHADKMAEMWDELNERIVACERCPRLRSHCEELAREKRAAFREETYWEKPVPNFGDADGRLLIVGLAPAAHGGTRTGRMFTGDRSGAFLFEAMHRAGFANQPTGTHRGDGLVLRDCAITAAAHCAPPANRPTREELDQCLGHLVDTFAAIRRLRVVVALGAVGFEAVLRAYRQIGWAVPTPRPRFAHGAIHNMGVGVVPPVRGGGLRAEGDGLDVPARRLPPPVLCTYHPSQQNTFTGRLTMDMLVRVLTDARRLAHKLA